MDQNTQSSAEAIGGGEATQPRFRTTARSRESKQPTHGSNRETIESVVIAFVLAFLFRTFEAEAFVIPTGSMAPTLMGRHKEIACRECGWKFSIGATEDQNRGAKLTDCICPNCRFQNEIASEPTFKGDRILVLKALFDAPQWVPASLREPKRWDVVVFKFPEDPQVNYIKRLVVLPNEELKIRYGNIYTRLTGENEFRIARKPPHKQKVMRMLVYDNNHQPDHWRGSGWPSRWQSEPGEPWKESEDGHSFESPIGLSEPSDWARLAYHHLVKNWELNELADKSKKERLREQLITDFYSYNAGISDGRFRDGEQQPHWVGDLALRLRAEVTAAKGKLRLELVEAGDRFVCEFDMTAGTCRLLKIVASETGEQVLGTASDGISKPGRYSICFGNTDDRLTVWLDDRLLFEDGHDYSGPGLETNQRPTRADLRPAAVAVQGTHVRVSDLVLYRDIYYTHAAGGSSGYEYDSFPAASWDDVLSDSIQWDVFAAARTSSFGTLGPDEFMMMGDNSPRSNDGRLWHQGASKWANEIADKQGLPRDEIATRPGGQLVLSPEHVVHRQLLIGRAFYVYWPHGVPFGPESVQFDINLRRFGTIRVPFYPNVSRMKMIE